MTDINFFLLFVSLSAFYHHLKFILLVSILYIYQIDMNIRNIVYVGIILIIPCINYFYWNINGLQLILIDIIKYTIKYLT